MFEIVAAFALGLLAGAALFALFIPTFAKRLQSRHQVEMTRYEQMLAELRQEGAEDRETNRRLRHELATNTPSNFEMVLTERDEAQVQLDDANSRLAGMSAELADRDRSLREARLAIQDIRVMLEQDRLAPNPGSAGGGQVGNGAAVSAVDHVSPSDEGAALEDPPVDLGVGAFDEELIDEAGVDGGEVYEEAAEWIDTVEPALPLDPGADDRNTLDLTHGGEHADIPPDGVESDPDASPPVFFDDYPLGGASRP